MVYRKQLRASFFVINLPNRGCTPNAMISCSTNDEMLSDSYASVMSCCEENLVLDTLTHQGTIILSHQTGLCSCIRDFPSRTTTATTVCFTGLVYCYFCLQRKTVFYSHRERCRHRFCSSSQFFLFPFGWMHLVRVISSTDNSLLH